MCVYKSDFVNVTPFLQTKWSKMYISKSFSLNVMPYLRRKLSKICVSKSIFVNLMPFLWTKLSKMFVSKFVFVNMMLFLQTKLSKMWVFKSIFVNVMPFLRTKSSAVLQQLYHLARWRCCKAPTKTGNKKELEFSKWTEEMVTLQQIFQRKRGEQTIPDWCDENRHLREQRTGVSGRGKTWDEGWSW